MSCWKPCQYLKSLWFKMDIKAYLHQRIQHSLQEEINLPTKGNSLVYFRRTCGLGPNYSNGICWISEDYSRHERQLSSVLRDGKSTTCLDIFTGITNSYFIMIPISPIHRSSFGWEDMVLTRHVHIFLHCCTWSCLPWDSHAAPTSQFNFRFI